MINFLADTIISTVNGESINQVSKEVEGKVTGKGIPGA